MKAWIVYDSEGCCATIVFAETRGKARSIALHTDVCEEMRFIDISPKRIKDADNLYHGCSEIDWDNEDDRNFMILHGWYCDHEYNNDEFNCNDCKIRHYCNYYIEYISEREHIIDELEQ